MRIHHLLAVVLLGLAAVLIGACGNQPTQTGILCAGECPKKPADLVPVSWAHAVYLAPGGIEFPAQVVDLAPDGTAELLITGLADMPDPEHPDAGATHPESITVAAPCLHFPGPAALKRPLDVAWAWPTDKAADARAGAFAGLVSDGSADEGKIRVALGGDPVEVVTLPALAVTDYPVWIPDPSQPMGASAAIWESECVTH